MTWNPDFQKDEIIAHQKREMMKAVHEAEARNPAETLRKQRIAASAQTYPDWLSTLNNIVRALEDEGDRVYLGSTNDADELREVVKYLDALSHNEGASA